MRAVAARANVDPALIYHYFEGKAGLIDDALVLPAAAADIRAGFSGNPQTAGEELVRHALDVWENDPQVRTHASALFRIALSDDRAANRLRAVQGAFVRDTVGDLVARDQREFRLGLVSAHMAGLFVSRVLLGFPDVVGPDPDTLAAAIGPTIQRYLTGPLTESPKR